MEFPGEFQIAVVVRRDGHDGSGAVAGQHVVGDPDRDHFVVDRIHRESPGEDPGLFLGQVGALQIALGRRLLAVSLDGFPAFRRHDFRQQFVFRRQDHIGRSEQGVGTGRKHGNRSPAFGQLEPYLRSLRAADPVPLHFLERLAPVHLFQPLQQAFGIGGDPQHPLPHRFPNDRKIADFASAVDHFLVRENGS